MLRARELGENFRSCETLPESVSVPECASVIGVVVGQIAGYRVDHALRDLRAARSIEEGHRAAVLLATQRGELGPKRVDIGSAHRLRLDSGQGDPDAGVLEDLLRSPCDQARHRFVGRDVERRRPADV